MAASMPPSNIAVLDRAGYVVIEAIAYDGRASSGTHSKPHTFIGIDGKTYWVKGSVQQGLVAELLAGRLAAKVSAGPIARIVRVTPEVIPAGAGAGHLEGLVVGSEDMPGTVNARDLAPFIANSQFQSGAIDPMARARVMVFQSWLSAGDAQVLVGLNDGAVYSIDHGDCFGATASHSDPSPIVVSIPGVADDLGRQTVFVEAAVTRIERLSDKDLQQAVSSVPAGAAWRSPVDRRGQIAEWLMRRRDRLRDSMRAWQLP